VVITAVCAFILKAHKSELVPLCLTAGGIILFLYVFDYLAECIDFIKSFSETTGVDNDIVRIIFKIIGIGFIVEMTASSIKDLGFESLSDKLVLCGKILIFVISVPIISSTYKIILSFIELV
jgi:stage III sporulation protein AD